MRRSVSTSYYALFHLIVRAGAWRFMGPHEATRPGYALLYRAFNHARMKSVCKSVDVPFLSPTLERQLGRKTVHPGLRVCANTFIALQEARHLADYDPGATFILRDVSDLTDLAQLGMSAFENAPVDERSDFLALMLATPRD